VEVDSWLVVRARLSAQECAPSPSSSWGVDAAAAAGAPHWPHTSGPRRRENDEREKPRNRQRIEAMCSEQATTRTGRLRNGQASEPVCQSSESYLAFLQL
jgi:cell division protein FtsN